MRKTVIFDIGNVLVFFSYPRMCKQLALVTGMTEETVKRELFDHSMGIRYEDGTLSDDDFYRFFAARARKKFSVQELHKAASDIFTENTSLYPLIQELKTKGFQLLLLSNTCPAHIEFLKREFPVFESFDGEVLSYKAGVRKPDPAIYREVIRLSKTEPANCFYTDDIAEYTQAARSLGINAETYITAEMLREHLQKYGFFENHSGEGGCLV